MENNNQEYEVITEPFIEIDIFSDTTKLPQSCKNELKTTYLSNEDEKILELFKLKEFISIDQLIRALYNRYAIEKTRAWVCSHLSSLNKKGHIKKLSGKKGVYAKAD